MALKREDAIRTITEGIAWVAMICKVRGGLNLFDTNVLSHDFWCQLLNAIYDLRLQVMDRIKPNFPAIDLGDATNKRAFQVTAEKSGEKIQTTLDKYVKYGLDQEYGKVQVLLIGDRQGSYKSLVIPTQLPFHWQDDIIDVNNLINEIEKLPVEKLERVALIVETELKSVRKYHPEDSPIRLNSEVTTKCEELEILQEASHGILDALRFLWMDHDGGMKDLEGHNVGHYLEAIGHAAAHLEPALLAFAEHFGLLARVSRKPYGTIWFTASSTMEYVIRNGIFIAHAIDGAFGDRTIRKKDGLTEEEREVYRKSWRVLRQPFSNSSMLPTYAKCVELAAEVDWEFHRAVGLLQPEGTNR